MNLCDDGHQSICYEGRQCPACDLRDELERSREQVEDLKDELQIASAYQCRCELAYRAGARKEKE